MSWKIISKRETAEEKVEDFDILEDGEVVAIERIYSSRTVMITEEEQLTCAPNFDPDLWTSTVQPASWAAGPRIVEHGFDYDFRTKTLTEKRTRRGESSWVQFHRSVQEIDRD